MTYWANAAVIRTGRIQGNAPRECAGKYAAGDEEKIAGVIEGPAEGGDGAPAARNRAHPENR